MCDIVGIYTDAGDLTAKYAYDSWGNVTSITDGNGNAITDQNHIGNLNPFRYRGYYMDTETGMYYLMSRYYDPVTHRFLNADGYFQTGLGILDSNMNAYCGNNPVNDLDPTGTMSAKEMQYGMIFNLNPPYTLKDVILQDKYEAGYTTNRLNQIGDYTQYLFMPRDAIYGAAGYYIMSPNVATGMSIYTAIPTTALSIVSHTQNPNLYDYQKGLLVLSDLANVAIVAGLTYCVTNFWHPGGWVGAVVTVGMIILPYALSSITSLIEVCFENKNRRSWLTSQ